MNDLDPVRAPERREWWMSLVIAVFTVLGVVVSWSWWAGSLGRFSVALVISCLIGWGVAWTFRRKLGRKN